MSETTRPSEPRQVCERIAVVVPALNAADTIGEQIAAVLADRDERVELVLVNNGSTDATLETMHALSSGHERITIVSEPRRGVNLARNAGIAATDAPIVLLCDADDEIEPGWINALASALETFDLVGGALRHVSRNGKVMSEAALPDMHNVFGWGVPYGWGGACGMRRATWLQSGGFDSTMSGGGDEADFFIRAQIDGATFTWRENAVVRCTQREDTAKHARRRRDEGWRNLTRCYWYGRLRGWPRYGHFWEDVLKSALLLPMAPFSAHWRSVLQLRLMRRWGRFRGALSYLPGELRRRVSNKSPRPLRFAPTPRFRSDWRRIDRIDGWLTREDAAVLHAAASRVASNEAIVEIGSWNGRSTTAAALGCRRQRVIYAVGRHTGERLHVEAGLPVDSLSQFKRTVSSLELTNVETVMALSHEAAKTYSGTPIGLLFIDGWNSTDAVSDDYASWAPHLAPGATIVFNDRCQPEVRAAILQLRPQLPRRMLEIGKLSIFTDW